MNTSRKTLLSMWKSLWAGQTEFPDSIWQNWAQMVKDMNKAGIPLMVGTDLMCPALIPGYSVHEEMAIWQEAGIPAADVLRSATIVPARFMGLDKRLVQSRRRQDRFDGTRQSKSAGGYPQRRKNRRSIFARKRTLVGKTWIDCWMKQNNLPRR